MRTLVSMLLLAAAAAPAAGPAAAAELRVAVASNFRQAMEVLARDFEERTGHAVTLSAGSTGKHYAQIRNGAPFDVFLAADERRPRLLEEHGEAVAGSRFTYARGRLVLWSADPALVDAEGRVLDESGFRYIAIANPRLAPYGRAAREVLERRGLWERLAGRIALGENVAQAFQFVRSGNAALGFVARSQVASLDPGERGSSWIVPGSLHEPIDQQAVLLRDGEAARALLDYVRSAEGRSLIREHGYDTP